MINIDMTPEIASALVGWVQGGDPSETLAAALSVFVNEEVGCEIIDGAKTTIVRVKIYSPELTNCVDDIMDFVLEMRDGDGYVIYERVIIDISMFCEKSQSDVQGS